MVEVPCEVCTTPVQNSCRRYGGRCCNACASFFARSVFMEKRYECKGTYECLKFPSVLGKGCRRCRWSKCLEIGMTMNGMNAVAQPQPPPPQQPQQQPTNQMQPQILPSQPLPPTPVAPQQPVVVVDPELEKAKLFAKIVDALLTLSMTYPNVVKEYFEFGRQEIISAAVAQAYGTDMSTTALTEKENFLAYLFIKFPVEHSEFAVFLRLLLCKFDLKSIPENEKFALKFLQNNAFSTLHSFNVHGIRLNQLIEISQHFLNVFKIYC